MNKIDAHARSVDELLGNKKYSIDYYQREYKWGTKQIIELLEDLEAKFLESYEADHQRIAIGHYKHYFLGSIIISDRDDKKFIIDGQQRLTSLTLLLIYLYRLQLEYYEGEKSAVQNLIFSDKFGQKSFNLDVLERRDCLDCLFKGQSFDPAEQPESVQNIVARYADIEANFPETLRGHALVYFVDWLKYDVDLIEITTSSDEEAYTIFETMNDRGLSLSPTDMLKGYLLANITNTDDRVQANDLWKSRLLDLTRLGKEEDTDFFKAWLRAQYAKSIREGKKGAVNKDFEMIGTTYHKWVHDESKSIGLKTSPDFRDFLMQEFRSFSGHYIRVRQAARQMTHGLEYVFYNAHNNFTLQYPLVLAPLRSCDNLDTVNRNHIGNLILLPGDKNKSLSDNLYDKKLDVYSRENVLSQAFCERFYHNNPGFLAYINRSGLPFRPHSTFKKADLDERQELYRLICEEIWSPARFDRELV